MVQVLASGRRVYIHRARRKTASDVEVSLFSTNAAWTGDSALLRHSSDRTGKFVAQSHAGKACANLLPRAALHPR